MALVNSAVLWYSTLKIEMILEKVMTIQSFAGARNILTGGKLLRIGGYFRLGGYWR